MLQKNLYGYADAVCMNAAIWSESGRLKNARENAGELGYQFRALAQSDEEGSVACITMGQLLQQAGMPVLDLLKIDIEGAEQELLSKHTHWIERVNCFTVELHDRFVPGCTDAYEKATKGFSGFRHGEYVFRYREEFR